MANEVIIQIKDRSKTAVCRETLALCGNYDVTVEDMLGNGYLVLHDYFVMPNVWPFDPDGIWSAPEASDARWFGYCTLTNGEGTLNLTMEKLVNKLSKHNKINSVVPVTFSVYKTGEGLIGTGVMSILVTEPYTTTSQSFVAFKGDKGDTGAKGDKGDTGSAGATGATGPQGPQGLTGPSGEKGDKGDPGANGAKGDKGDRGEKGEKGDPGIQGPRGEQGLRGEQGPIGLTGPKGECGDDGKPGHISQIIGEDGYWHSIHGVMNDDDEMVVCVDSAGSMHDYSEYVLNTTLDRFINPFIDDVLEVGEIIVKRVEDGVLYLGTVPNRGRKVVEGKLYLTKEVRNV